MPSSAHAAVEVEVEVDVGDGDFRFFDARLAGTAERGLVVAVTDVVVVVVD